MAAKRFYVMRDGQRSGPVRFGVLQQMSARGELGPADWVFCEGDVEWRRAESYEGLAFRQVDSLHALAAAAQVSSERAAAEHEENGAGEGNDRAGVVLLPETIALVLSLMGLMGLSLILGVAAIVLAWPALKRPRGSALGRNLARTAVVIGCLDVLKWMAVMAGLRWIG